MPKYLSGRQKLRPSNKLTEDRYQYLGLDQAEPNLADPLTSPGVPGGTQYQLIAVAGYDGRRYWVPVGGSLQPGAITIFDEGTPVSSASSITQLNFVGAAVTARVGVQNPSGHPGIAATVTVIPVTVGENPPNTPTPNNGELWWERDTGDLYVYYNDGDSAQWVMANSGGRGLTGDKGEVGPKGEKGQKGEIGNTGSQGDKGEKGAPSTVAGAKGQKGEIGIGQKGEPSTVKGDKGQKGEIGADGNDGAAGQKGEKGDGSAGGAQVTISDTAPTSPTPANGDLWWESDTFDLHVYYEDGSSNQWVSITSNAALKGEKGDKGQKGEVGDKGQKGEIGSKGEKGEIGSTGGTGGTGAKGQKGEIGATGADGAAAAKGQKGEVGATGSSGSAGDKGSTGDKGDKGAPSTVAGDKGQKGEIGATGSGGSTGSAGDKGQKGEEGPQGGGAPVGQIVAWSGSGGSLPSGYFLCDGSAISRSTYAALFAIVGTTHGAGNGSSTFNIPDLRDRFIVGASNSTGDTSYPGVSPGATGGSANATLVTHSHTINNHTHSFSATTNNPGDHDHNVDVLAEFASTHGTWQTGGGYRQVHTGGTHRKPITSDAGGHTHTISGTTGNPSNTGTNSQGSSATNANLPPYYSLAYIIQYAQGGTTAKGQKGEVGATGSGGSTGDKGQKGEVGDKGAASSVQGPAGDKGQKGEVGATGAGGSTGSAGAKGQKGEIGSTGDKGQKGEIGATGSTGSAGSDGSDGDKGQKGEIGTKGEVGAAGTLATSGFKKVRTASLSGNYQLSNGGSWTNVVQIPSFTPNSTNSVFLITITIGGFSRWNGTGSATGQMRVRDATDNSNIDGFETLKNTANDAGQHFFSLIDTKGGTTNRNYAVQLNSGNNNGLPQISNVRIMCIEMDTTV